MAFKDNEKNCIFFGRFTKFLPTTTFYDISRFIRYILANFLLKFGLYLTFFPTEIFFETAYGHAHLAFFIYRDMETPG
jgi:hypothetical protein